MINALVIHNEDDVAVVIEAINKGEEVSYEDTDGKVKTVKALNDIPVYHKIAIRDIDKEKHVNKYGEHIGVASMLINKGEHVHEHNVGSIREDLYDK